MNEPGIDLTGKLIIKVALGDDIRRILITNEDITYDELVLMMQRVYRGKLNSSDDIVIKYKDEDNDLITIFESSDLNFAIQCSRILKITLFVNGKPEPLQTDEVKMIKSELKYIRERCNKLIDKLDDRQSQDTSASSTVDSTIRIAVPQPKSAESPHTALPNPNEAAPRRETGSKEFDPLSTHRPTEDSQKRSGTPDSITSVGSASSNRPQQPRGGTPTIPVQAQPGQISGMFQQGSGQKVLPWQNQLAVGPSQYSPTPTDQQAASAPLGYTSQPQSNQSQPGYGQPAAATSQYGVYNQQQSSGMPGQHPNFVGPQQQQHPGAFGSQPQQPAPAPQQQIPQQPNTYAYAQGQQQQPQQQPQQQQPQQQQQAQQQQPGFVPTSSNPGTTTANPYARHGPSYAAGYPRPTGNYAGYQ